MGPVYSEVHFAIASLERVVLLSATTNAPVFQCVTADRTALDSSAGTMTYVWHVKGQGGQPKKDITVGYVVNPAEPDRGIAIINPDTLKPIPTLGVYTDYKSSFIDKMNFGTQEICFQWVTAGTENAVPQACSAAMTKNCPGAMLLYKDSVCH